MKILKDNQGNNIRLTDERLEHILLHPEMIELQNKIETAIINPDYIIKSKVDKNVKLFNKFYITKQFGGKYLCVVVKYEKDDAFIITSYLIRELPKGDILWQKN